MQTVLPIAVHCFPFTDVMSSIGFETDAKALYQWDYFDLPFPKDDTMIIMDPRDVLAKIQHVLNDSLGTQMMFDALKCLNVIPQETTDFQYVDADEDNPSPYDLSFTVPGQPDLRFSERHLAEQMCRTFEERWNAIMNAPEGNDAGIWLNRTYSAFWF